MNNAQLYEEVSLAAAKQAVALEVLLRTMTHAKYRDFKSLEMKFLVEKIPTIQLGFKNNIPLQCRKIN